jgi:sugar lactone lactonase YvrE
VLDPGSINLAPTLHRAPKLWAYDLTTRKPVVQIAFPVDVAMKKTYLNDVRIDVNRGARGTAYITDSGAGGIIVVDVASGTSWRHLDGHPSVMPTIGLQLASEGKPLMQHKESGEIAPPDFRSDGIALSPDAKTLYYNAIVSRDIYAVPTDLLSDKNTDPARLAAAVRKVATKPSGNDGLACDLQGRVLSADFEDNAIRATDPTSGAVTVISQDERMIWPDTLSVHGGYVYVTSNQLPRQPSYHAGKDLRKPPHVLFRVPLTPTPRPAQ